MSSIDSVAIDLGIVVGSLIITAGLTFICEEHITLNGNATRFPSALALLLFVA
jgi:hypothetical protein